MNIFGIGGAELILIILIMLVVAGPQRMIRWAYWLGVYTGKLRKMWAQTISMVQQEIDAAGVDIQLPKELPTRQNIGKLTQQVMKPLTKQMEEAAKSVENEMKPIQENMKKAQESLNSIGVTKLPTNGTVATPIRPTAAKPAAAPPPAPPPAPKPDTPSGFGTWSQSGGKPEEKNNGEDFGTWGGAKS